VICAPVVSAGEWLATQVPVGPSEGLKHPSWILCDGLASIEKVRLTDYVGTLSAGKMRELSAALRAALDL
jgi:mRNA-degrading endonuclease toxin of MazEF toxin-antitoxin module